MEQEEYLEDQRNRLEYSVDYIINLEDAEIIPEIGRYYTFIYAPKTPRIRYDQFPLIACTDLQQWGFRGMNYHWPGFRNYTWEEVVGYLHVAYPMEMTDLRSIPYQNFKINN